MNAAMIIPLMSTGPTGPTDITPHGTPKSKCHKLQDKYYRCLEKNSQQEVICIYWLNSWGTCLYMCREDYVKYELRRFNKIE